MYADMYHFLAELEEAVEHWQAKTDAKQLKLMVELHVQQQTQQHKQQHEERMMLMMMTVMQQTMAMFAGWALQASVFLHQHISADGMYPSFHPPGVNLSP